MHVQVISPSVAEQIRKSLEEGGFEIGAAPYSTFEAVGSDVRVTYYPKKGKLLIQGNGTEGLLLRLRELLGTVPEEEPEEEHRVDVTTIGSDESGKGDYFGPLVVAGCRVEKKDLEWIQEAGIKDSKEASRHAILMQEGRILDRLETAVVELLPEEYGRRHEETGNVNRILGEAHAQVIRKLRARGGCNRAVVDRFGGEHYVREALGPAGKNLTLIQIPRAEANPAVACASFLARARFLYALDRLSDEVGVDLLPGASAEVEECARKVVAVGGRDLLAKVAKMHFKTTRRVLR